VEEFLKDFPCKTIVTSDPDLKRAVMPELERAVATSGTVGLELAVADVPHVIAYRANPITAGIIRRKIRVRFAHLANLLLDFTGDGLTRSVVPEFIQEYCTAPNITAALETIDIDRQKRAFARVRGLLEGVDEDGPPSAQAAAFILSLR
jgi:lipid-A-disaccharide synthase